MRRLVWKFYLYRAFAAVGFISPVFTLFLLYRDLTFTQIGTLSGLSAVLVVVGEVPTGYVADRYGRRTSMVLGLVFSAASVAGFVVVETFPAFVVLYALWAFGLAFASGSVSAYLYDALRAELATESFTRIRGRGEAVHAVTNAVTMVAGGLLYAVDPTYPFVALAGFSLLGVPVLLSLPTTRTEEAPVTPLDAAGALRRELSVPAVRRFLLYVGLFYGVVSGADTYIQPIAVGLFETELGSLTVAGHALPPPVLLGVMYAAFTGTSAVASYHAGTLETLLGRRRALLAVPGVAAVTLVAPLALPLFAVPMFFVMRGSRAALRPVADRYLNDRVGSESRATTLSAASMLYSTVRLPLAVGAGVLADATRPIVAVAALGVLFLVGAGLTRAAGGPD